MLVRNATLGSIKKRTIKGALISHALDAALLLAVGSTATYAQPISVCPANPHYFMYKGKPILLITSDHHYGAVIDRDFDYAKFLKYLGDNGMNLTRIYPGGYFETPDEFIKGNPLGPLPGHQILPWAKSKQTGANPTLAEPGQPSYRYDLDKWNPEYFARLKAFVELARQKDIIVEVAFFNQMYEVSWPVVALYHGNNIQNVGQYEGKDFWLFSSADPRNADVMERQKAYIAKITRELNGYDNVIFDICDEPELWTKPGAQVVPWIVALKDAFLSAERELPKKHLLGQTVRGASAPTLSSESWNEWLPTEYITYAEEALTGDYVWNKPIVVVETAWYNALDIDNGYKDVNSVRMETWEFMVGGGAGHINLNGEYYHGQETGGSDTHTGIVPQKKILREFLDSFDYVRMRRLTDYTSPSGTVSSAMAENGQQYAFYIFHGQLKNHCFWVGTPGEYQDEVTLNTIPAGTYRLEWIDPATGAVKHTETRTHVGAKFVLKTPAYSMDLALRMRRGM
ncbi:MAG TPA: hypothetical protein VMW38_16365 [Terriglobia bacterium]|nr:hypothetical protein [Terriglobia bacterium]